MVFAEQCLLISPWHCYSIHCEKKQDQLKLVSKVVVRVFIIKVYKVGTEIIVIMVVIVNVVHLVYMFFMVVVVIMVFMIFILFLGLF
jgi:hypothetical protein